MASDHVHRLFIYGTLKRGQPNHFLLADRTNGWATFIGCGCTRAKYPLIISTNANIPSVLIKEKGIGHHIQGEIWDVDDKMRATLDEFEGYPDYYDIAHTAVAVEGNQSESPRKEITCLMYAIRSYNRHHLLKLPFHSNYDSNGEHGLPYISENDDYPDFNEAGS